MKNVICEVEDALIRLYLIGNFFMLYELYSFIIRQTRARCDVWKLF